MVACQKGLDSIVQRLLAARADLKLTYGIGFPLSMAADHANVSTVDLLLRSGADVNQADQSGETALMTVASYHRSSIRQLKWTIGPSGDPLDG